MSAQFTVRPVDLDRMRPVRFVWRPWLVADKLNLMVGEETIGKSTFAGYLAAAVTRGELPGAFEGKPRGVLFVGADEDGFYDVTVPRLYAAGADFEHVGEFCALDEVSSFDVEAHAAQLSDTLSVGDYALVVFEHLMDILPPMRNYTDPAALRRALLPLRRVLLARSVAGMGTLHVNKTPAATFRARAQGSMQFGAMARSTFLLDRHPNDPLRRVLVLGPSNYIAEAGPRALSFEIANHFFTHNGRDYEVGRVTDVHEEEGLSMEDVLDTPDRRRAIGEENRASVLTALDDETQSVADIAETTGLSESTVSRHLSVLEKDGSAVKEGAGWRIA